MALNNDLLLLSCEVANGILYCWLFLYHICCLLLIISIISLRMTYILHHQCEQSCLNAVLMHYTWKCFTTDPWSDYHNHVRLQVLMLLTLWHRPRQLLCWHHAGMSFTLVYSIIIIPTQHIKGPSKPWLFRPATSYMLQVLRPRAICTSEHKLSYTSKPICTTYLLLLRFPHQVNEWYSCSSFRQQSSGCAMVLRSGEYVCSLHFPPTSSCQDIRAQSQQPHTSTINYQQACMQQCCWSARNSRYTGWIMATTSR